MGTSLLTDVPREICNAFAKEPQRSWLLDRLGEWQHDPVARPHHPPRGQSEVNAANELPSGEPVPDSERAIHTLPEICFTLAAIHDAYRGVLGRAMNVEVEPFVERGGALWELLAPHYGLRVAFEQRATTAKWTDERLNSLGVLIDQSIAAANAAGCDDAARPSEPTADCSRSPSEGPGEPAPETAEERRSGENAVPTASGGVAGGGQVIADQPISPGGVGDREGVESRRQTRAVGFLGGSALADAFNIPARKRANFAKALERIRPRLGSGFLEVANPASNEPRFRYAVENDLVKEAASKYTPTATA
jgi:hypothetical protein